MLFMQRIIATFSSCFFKPGLHISRKDRKHWLENMFFKLSRYGLVSMWYGSNDRKY